MSEFDHWYTKEDYEALERKLNSEITALKKKITAVKDAIEGVDPVRSFNAYQQIANAQAQGAIGRQASLYGPYQGGGGLFNAFFG